MENITNIRNPEKVMRDYFDNKNLRSLESISIDECKQIINLAVDNGNFKGIAVNDISIHSSCSNFVEGNVSFGNKDTYLFVIALDATIEIRKMIFNEQELRFIPSKETMKIYRFVDIVLSFMKMGIDITKEWK